MQGLGNLLDMLGSADQASLRSLSQSVQNGERDAAALSDFLGLLQSQLAELEEAGEIASGDTNVLLGEFLSPAILSQTDLSSGLSFRQQVTSADETTPLSLLYNQIFANANNQPVDLGDIDPGILKLIDYDRLAEDLAALQKLVTAVSTNDGEPLTEEELLAILQSALSEDSAGEELDTSLDISLTDGEASDGDNADDAQAAAAGSLTQAADADGETLDPDSLGHERQVADKRLADRLQARDARIAATEEGAEPEDGDGLDVAATAMPVTPTTTNGQAGTGPINLNAQAQLASVNGPDVHSGNTGGRSSGQGAFGDSPFGPPSNQDGLTNAAQNAANLNNTQASFQNMLAASTPSRAPMNPATMQVNVHLRNAVTQGQTQLRIQLQPATLGSVDVELTFDKEGSVRGKLIADRPETLDMLRHDSRTLEKSLQDAGLQLESGGLEFSLRDGGNAHGDSSQANNSNNNGTADGSIGSDAEELVDLSGSIEIITEDQVDVRV